MGQDISFWLCKKEGVKIPKEIPHLVRGDLVAFPINTSSGTYIEELIKEVVKDNSYDIRLHLAEEQNAFLKLAIDLDVENFRVIHTSDYADIPVYDYEFTVENNIILKDSILFSSCGSHKQKVTTEYDEDKYLDDFFDIPIDRRFFEIRSYDHFIFQYKYENFMSYFMIDVETDGPIPGDYSMISFGAVIVDENLDKTFYGKLRPISEKYHPDALKISGHTREETLAFDKPLFVMQKFAEWIRENSKGRPIFISDNNGFDFMFITWYFHHFMLHSPFGHSSQNLGSLYKGITKDTFQNFKHLRDTSHTHNPVDDAMGNAEALLKLKKEFGLKISLE